MPLSHSVLENKTTFKCDYLNGEEMYNLLDTTFEIPQTGFQFNIFKVSPEYVARPDLISLDAYSSTIYTDVICKLNNISNPFELNEGMEIIIPTSQYISQFLVSPNEAELESSNDIQKPIATTKLNKTRKANEALVNNTRFKVDSASGIIIY